MRHNAKQKGVTGDVEGNAKANVCGSLEKCTTEFVVFGYVELREDVAGRQGHFVQI